MKGLYLLAASIMVLLFAILIKVEEEKTTRSVDKLKVEGRVIMRGSDLTAPNRYVSDSTHTCVPTKLGSHELWDASPYLWHGPELRFRPVDSGVNPFTTPLDGDAGGFTSDEMQPHNLKIRRLLKLAPGQYTIESNFSLKATPETNYTVKDVCLVLNRGSETAPFDHELGSNLLGRTGSQSEGAYIFSKSFKTYVTIHNDDTDPYVWLGVYVESSSPTLSLTDINLDFKLTTLDSTGRQVSGEYA